MSEKNQKFKIQGRVEKSGLDLDASSSKLMAQCEEILKMFFFCLLEKCVHFGCLTSVLKKETKLPEIYRSGSGKLFFVHFNVIWRFIARSRQFLRGGIVIKNGFVFEHK